MSTSPIWRIGLTGGIGSGKSTVASILRERGAAVIDADVISRSVTAPGGAAIGPIASTFGATMIQADGSLNREAMRQKVFTDPAARQALESIIHPLVTRTIGDHAAQALEQGFHVLVYDVPLLVEGLERWRPQVDVIWVVDCPTATQIERVMQRSGLSRQEVERIIAQQATREQRLACADIVTLNDGIDLDTLKTQVIKTAQRFGL